MFLMETMFNALSSAKSCIAVDKSGYVYSPSSKDDKTDKERCKPLDAKISHNFKEENVSVSFYANYEFTIVSLDVVYDFGEFKLPENDIKCVLDSRDYEFSTKNIPRHVFYPEFTLKVVYKMNRYPGNFGIEYHFDIPYFQTNTAIKLEKLDGYEIPEGIKSAFDKNDETELLKDINPTTLSREDKLRHALYVEDLTTQKEMSVFKLFNIKVERVSHDPDKRITLFRFQVKNKKSLPTSVLETSLEFIPMSREFKDRKLTTPERSLRKESGNRPYYTVERVDEDGKDVTWIECSKFENTFKPEILDLNLRYEVRFIPNNVTFQACHKALNSLVEKRLKSFFESFGKSSITFSREVFKDFANEDFVWFNKNINSNEEQKIAIKNIVRCSAYPLPYCIFGPPGTGKTSCVVECILQILKMRPSSKILVNAQSNSACNEIGDRLLEFIGIENVFRLYSSRLRNSNPGSVSEKLLPSSNLREKNRSIFPTMEELKSFPIIISTISSASQFDRALLHDYFDYIFIDESAATTEPEACIPIVALGCGESKVHANIVLVGDPKQLPPVVNSSVAKHLSLNVSLMERVMTTRRYQQNPNYNSKYITQLLDNYRSHPSILHFSNVSFYDSKLRSKGTGDNISIGTKWNGLPRKNFPIIFHCVKDASEKEGTSSFNQSEAKIVESFVARLLTEGIGKKQIVPEDIGVVTPYKAQTEKLKEILPKTVEIGTSEYYQGREKLIIIISTVKSQTGIGFLGDEQRLNVCLTRAKTLMIVVGNANTLQKNMLWRQFIHYCRANNSCVGDKFFMKNVNDPVVANAGNQMVPYGNRNNNRRGKKKNQAPNGVNKEFTQMMDQETCSRPGNRSFRNKFNGSSNAGNQQFVLPYGNGNNNRSFVDWRPRSNEENNENTLKEGKKVQQNHSFTSNSFCARKVIESGPSSARNQMVMFPYGNENNHNPHVSTWHSNYGYKEEDKDCYLREREKVLQKANETKNQDTHKSKNVFQRLLGAISKKFSDISL